MIKTILVITGCCLMFFFIVAIYSCFIVSGGCSEMEGRLDIDQNDNKNSSSQ